MTFDFREITRAVEDGLVRELRLSPISLPAGLTQLEGVWRERPVHLQARAYTGERIRLARFVEVCGAELEIGNLLCLSAPEYPLPILGVDLVDLGRDMAVVVADLSSMTSDSNERTRQLDVLRRHRGAPSSTISASTTPPRELPSWATPWFSSEALSARVPAERAADVLPAVSAYASAFVELATSTSRADGAAHVARQHAAYATAHRESDRGLQLLGKIFPPVVADRFLREVLFPERLES